MIIFLYGADSYRSRQKLDEIISQYKSVRKSGLNLLHMDAEKIGFTEFFGTFRAVGMFAEKKLVVLKNIFADKKFQDDFLGELKTLQALPDIIVVYEPGEVDQRLKLFKQLVKEAKCQEFSVLAPAQLKSWVQKEFAARGQKANLDAIDMLVQYVGQDSWRLHNEIKKLADYKHGQTVKKDDVVHMVRPAIELDIFKTIDALAQKNKKQAMVLIAKHIDEGENVLYLLSMIAFQFKNLLTVKELAQKGMMYESIVKKSGLHPFVVKKTYLQCHQFTLEELKKIYRRIFKADTDIKTGKIEPETALDLLVGSL